VKSEKWKVKSYGSFFRGAQKALKMKISEQSEEILLNFTLYTFHFTLQ